MLGLFRRRRARRLHAAALEVLHHAAVTRFRDTPASQIRALDALKLWHGDFIEAPDPFEAIASASSPASLYALDALVTADESPSARPR